jgi:endonuclease/exonuclease/phosphatase family metal-dependent hydrolase
MRKFLFWLFAIITFIPAVVYFVSCLTPYISPVSFWPMAFLALGFPYLAAAVAVLAILWIFVKRKVSLYLLILLLVGFPNVRSTFAINAVPNARALKDSGTLRVLTWNVRGFDNPAIHADSPNSPRRLMFAYIKKANPDILCLQEFTEHEAPSLLSNTKDLLNLGYKYYYKTNDQIHYFKSWNQFDGTAIFSKIPIIDTGRVLLGDPSYPEHLAYIDVSLKNKPVRIFSTHFKSMHLFVGPKNPDRIVVLHGDEDIVYNTTRFEKLKLFGKEHSRQAEIAKNEVNKSPYPVVFSADMNSVPTSYAYHTMCNKLQDAFITKGFGLGTTLDSLPKTLRIDYFFVDKKLFIKNYWKDDISLSDHFPQLIDVSWRDN